MADIRGKTFEQIADEATPGETFTVGSFDVEELRDKLPPGDVEIHEREARQPRVMHGT